MAMQLSKKDLLNTKNNRVPEPKGLRFISTLPSTIALWHIIYVLFPSYHWGKVELKSRLVPIIGRGGGKGIGYDRVVDIGITDAAKTTGKHSAPSIDLSF
ncbi:hypothetical protein TWF970_005624 [Orbilia oligospora]|uniref:Uncharacterized protein n=1 Tax=Orbilia oligospora TaxID=2813651 RepID=A0A7C8VII7_ORBOL|nr:hypothetical protein TWF970_005624 [Orbilia oligospora]